MYQAYGKSEEESEKAGYNQSGKITEILANLRVTFISSMMANNFDDALESIRCILSIISGKARESDIEEMDKEVYKIEFEIPKSKENYINNGLVYWKNYGLRIELKRKIENLYRKLERMEDRYGYGMVSAEDPRLAVLKK